MPDPTEYEEKIRAALESYYFILEVREGKNLPRTGIAALDILAARHDALCLAVQTVLEQAKPAQNKSWNVQFNMTDKTYRLWQDWSHPPTIPVRKSLFRRWLKKVF